MYNCTVEIVLLRNNRCFPRVSRFAPRSHQGNREQSSLGLAPRLHLILGQFLVAKYQFAAHAQRSHSVLQCLVKC